MTDTTNHPTPSDHPGEVNLGSDLGGKYTLAMVFAYMFGIIFQYFSVAPMRGLGLGDGLLAGVKIDTLSLLAYQAGMFAWMGFRVWLYPELTPTTSTYWLMAQVAMVPGFATTYPVNWWLISRGIKEKMWEMATAGETHHNAAKLSGTLRGLFRAPVLHYRRRLGWLLGHRFMLLVHVGRRSGLRRRTVLEVIEYRNQRPEVVVMSAFGFNADWFRNIQATPGPDVIVGWRCFRAAHRTLDEPEAMSVIAGYERRPWLVAPIIRAVLSRLVGWRYDSSDTARHRLASELPLVTFQPLFEQQRDQLGANIHS